MAYSPSGSGTVDVQVRTPAGTSAANTRTRFTYSLTPAVESVAPAAGPAQGGTPVLVSGSGFVGATAVSFGATPARSFTINSDTELTAVAPAGSATVDVRVTTRHGTSTVSPFDTYFFSPAPVVTGVSPATGPASGGTSVVISGQNLTPSQLFAYAVRFGSVSATFFAQRPDGTILATSPPGAGKVDVTVTTAGGTSAPNPADAFTYT